MGIAMHGPLTDCEDKVGVIGKADLNLPMKHSMPKNDAFKDKLFTLVRSAVFLRIPKSAMALKYHACHG
jgi:hypothetical protein